jgi:hypothetical protein
MLWRFINTDFCCFISERISFKSKDAKKISNKDMEITNKMFCFFHKDYLSYILKHISFIAKISVEDLKVTKKLLYFINIE